MTQVNVCVLAPTRAQLPKVEAVLGAEVTGKRSDLEQAYHGSSDDWRPFGGTTSILDYVRAMKMDPASLTMGLARFAQPDRADQLVRDVDLLLIDPLFVAASLAPDVVLNRLEASIRRARGGFCFVYPVALAGMHHTLEQACKDRLPLLHLAVKHGRWMALNERGLTEYLEVFRQIGMGSREPDSSPHPDTAALVMGLLRAGAERDLSGVSLPNMGGTH